ncbi:dihydroorotate dehydrogenase, partial [Streptococcus suis]
MTAELRANLEGGRIQKINQPFEQEIVLNIRSNRQSHKLLLSAHSVFGRVQLTQSDFTNPKVPNTFTMILRKYLQGAIIEEIRQLDNDRILEFSVSNKDEIGDHIQATLIVEIMGKHSNIILVDKSEQKIIEAIKHVGFSQNSYRTILPGSTYIRPPETHSLNPYTVSDEKLFEILSTQELSPKNLQQVFQGLGRDTASELANHLQIDRLKNFRAFFDQATQPSLTDKSYAALPFANSPENQPHFESLSSLLDFYYQDKAERDRVAQQANELIKRVASELEKNRKKLIKQEQELADTETAELVRQKGELLTTYLHQVPNDQSSVRLDNYYTGKELEIELDVALTPSQNAQRYFKKYQKLKEAVKHLTNLIEETKSTIVYLESVDTMLGQASLAEIDEIREELIETGYLKRRHREKIHKRQKPERYLATDGKTIILVGKNNLQNDELTFKMAKKGELWFHAKDIPGSH